MNATHDADVIQTTVSPTQEIVERIAALEESAHTELDPLSETIDPDALNTLVGPASRSNATLKIEFTYHGYDVTVTGDSRVHVDENVSFKV